MYGKICEILVAEHDNIHVQFRHYLFEKTRPVLTSSAPVDTDSLDKFGTYMIITSQ